MRNDSAFDNISTGKKITYFSDEQQTNDSVKRLQYHQCDSNLYSIQEIGYTEKISM